MPQIEYHIKVVQDRIKRAALIAGTNPSSIRLIAVSKKKTRGYDPGSISGRIDGVRGK